MERTSLHDRIAATLRAARVRSGLSQRQLAAKIGTNQTRIALTETGDQNVRLVEFVEWCGATGIDPVEALRSVVG